MGFRKESLYDNSIDFLQIGRRRSDCQIRIFLNLNKLFRWFTIFDEANRFVKKVSFVIDSDDTKILKSFYFTGVKVDHISISHGNNRGAAGALTAECVNKKTMDFIKIDCWDGGDDTFTDNWKIIFPIAKAKRIANDKHIFSGTNQLTVICVRKFIKRIKLNERLNMVFFNISENRLKRNGD